MGGYVLYDGARISLESPLGKQLQEWERKPDWTPEGNPFPKMLYRAQHRPDGKRSVGESNDALFPVQGDHGPIIQAGAAEQWSRRCQLTVRNEDEMRRAFDAGWHPHPTAALEALERRDNAVSNETAARHAADARLSERAQAEAKAADETSLKHQPELDAAKMAELKEAKRARMAKARAARAAKKDSPAA